MLKIEANEAKKRKEQPDPIEPWRFHDIRRTVATNLQKLNIRFEVTEAVLNHLSGSKTGVAGVYQRHDWAKEKREALAAWAIALNEIISPSDGTKVVHIGVRASAA